MLLEYSLGDSKVTHRVHTLDRTVKADAMGTSFLGNTRRNLVKPGYTKERLGMSRRDTYYCGSSLATIDSRITFWSPFCDHLKVDLACSLHILLVSKLLTKLKAHESFSIKINA